MATFYPRFTEPSYDDLNWIHYTNGGYNYCIELSDDGQVLPNCTAYAWGRWRELLGDYHNLSRADAEKWYGNTGDGYERGQYPRLGAVICWAKGSVSTDSDGAGHVAIVEQINSDGSIVTSNSAYGGERFYTRDRDNTYASSGYTFQGFIYLPISFDEGGGTEPDPEPSNPLPDVTPISKNAYLSESERQTNAIYIAKYLLTKGWTLNAVSGLLGNLQRESTINPGIWQSLNEGNTSGGLGLVQWTPATNLIDWCTDRGLDYLSMDAQLQRILYEVPFEGLQWITTDTYPMSFSDFTKSTDSPETLASVFLYNYERAGVSAESERRTNARNWYDFLSEYDLPSAPVEPDINWKRKKRGYNFVLFNRRKRLQT